MHYVLGQGNFFEGIAKSLKRFFIACQENNYEPQLVRSRVVWYTVVLLLVVKIFTIALVLPLPKNIFFADITRSQLLVFLNDERKNLGLNTLAESEKLNTVAYLKAQDMIAKQYFSHQSPDGTTPWYWFGKADYAYAYAGENLAIGFFESRDVYQAWLDSPSHKANMVNSHYTEVGTAVLSGFGQNGAIVVVQVFGSPKAAVVASNTKPQTPTSPAGRLDPKQTQNTNIENTKPEPPATPEPEVVEEKAIVQENHSQEKVLSESSDNLQISQPSNKPVPKINQIITFIIYHSKTLQYISYLLLITVAACLYFYTTYSHVQKHSVMARSLTLIIMIIATIVLEESFMLSFVPPIFLQ